MISESMKRRRSIRKREPTVLQEEIEGACHSQGKFLRDWVSRRRTLKRSAISSAIINGRRKRRRSIFRSSSKQTGWSISKRRDSHDRRRFNQSSKNLLEQRPAGSLPKNSSGLIRMGLISRSEHIDHGFLNLADITRYRITRM